MFYAWGAPLRNWVNVSTCLSNSTPKKQKGTPWECGFSLHSATTDTAHVPWFSHCFATIDNFCLVFLQWLNKTKIKKNKTKMTRPNSLPLLPLGVCNLVFFFFVFYFVFLVSCVFWFVVGFSAMAKQNQNPKKKKKHDKTQLSATTPPFGVCNFVFLGFLGFFGFLFSGSLLVF